MQGWVKLRSFTEPRDQILEYKKWYIGAPDHWEPIKPIATRVQHQQIVVKFAGVDTPEQARLLTHKYIAVERSQLPRLGVGEYYWSDLEGMRVFDQHEVDLGIVSHLLETGSNDVLIVKGEKEHAIPYLPDVIVHVDLNERIIRINWEL